MPLTGSSASCMHVSHTRAFLSQAHGSCILSMCPSVRDVLAQLHMHIHTPTTFDVIPRSHKHGGADRDCGAERAVGRCVPSCSCPHNGGCISFSSPPLNNSTIKQSHARTHARAHLPFRRLTMLPHHHHHIHTPPWCAEHCHPLVRWTSGRRPHLQEHLWVRRLGSQG